MFWDLLGLLKDIWWAVDLHKSWHSALGAPDHNFKDSPGIALQGNASI